MDLHIGTGNLYEMVVKLQWDRSQDSKYKKQRAYCENGFPQRRFLKHVSKTCFLCVFLHFFEGEGKRRLLSCRLLGWYPSTLRPCSSVAWSSLDQPKVAQSNLEQSRVACSSLEQFILQACWLPPIVQSSLEQSRVAQSSLEWPIVVLPITKNVIRRWQADFLKLNTLFGVHAQVSYLYLY